MMGLECLTTTKGLRTERSQMNRTSAVNARHRCYPALIDVVHDEVTKCPFDAIAEPRKTRISLID